MSLDLSSITNLIFFGLSISDLKVVLYVFFEVVY